MLIIYIISSHVRIRVIVVLYVEYALLISLVVILLLMSYKIRGNMSFVIRLRRQKALMCKKRKEFLRRSLSMIGQLVSSKDIYPLQAKEK